MNCPNCGTVLPNGAQSCPACGTFIPGVQDYNAFSTQSPYSQGFDPTAFSGAGTPPAQGYPQGGYAPGAYPQAGGYSQNGYPQDYGQNGYPQGFDPMAYGYTQNGFDGYPQGYQPVYGRYNSPMGDRGAFLGALSNLPRVLAGLFRDPGETLQGMMERNDLYTGSVVAGLSLLLTFLCAMTATHSVVSAALPGLSSLLGTPLAGDATSMSQGVNYIAGKMAASVGGIAAFCQLIALVFPAVVTLVYLCVIRKVRFSFLLASNLVALMTLPSIAAAVLCMLGSLISPYVGLVPVFVGVIASDVLLCTLVARITGIPEQQSAPVKIALVCIAELLKIVFMQLIGGSLAVNALGTISGLIATMGSLL